MRLVHDPDGEGRVLATELEFAETFLARARGLMFRRSIPDDYALVFRFGRTKRQNLHMVFVPFPIDALWLLDGEVQRVERLSSWTGRGAARCDTIVELPAGAAEEVAAGDRVVVQE